MAAGDSNNEVEYEEVGGTGINISTGNDFIDNNQTTIGIVVGAILLLVSGYLAYKYIYQGPREKTAMEQIFKAEEQFQRDSFALALEAPGGGYEGFLDIIDNYGGTKTANIAKYYAGISYLNLGRFEDAISYLDAYNASGNITPQSKYGALGDAYSELGQMDNAISAYSKAANGKNEYLTPYYLYKLGLIAKSQNENSKALSAFEKIIADYPKSSQAEEAKKYIGLLN